MLSSDVAAGARDKALNSLFDLSATWFDAGQRLTGLYASASREAVHQGSRQLAGFGHGQIDSLTQFPAALWLEAGARTARLFDASLAVAGETHRALLQAAEAQVHLFDETVASLSGRSRLVTPWESGLALATLRTTLEKIERTMHGTGKTSAEPLAMAGAEAHPIAGQLKENAPTTRPDGRGRTRS
jgi:hypothetical protein